MMHVIDHMLRDQASGPEFCTAIESSPSSQQALSIGAARLTGRRMPEDIS